MRKAPFIAAARLLSLGIISFAAEKAGIAGGSGITPRMQGSPNAAGFGKAEITGTTGVQTPNSAQNQDGRMKSPSNAGGFKQYNFDQAPNKGGAA